MTPVDILQLLLLFSAAAAVLATLFVKGKSKAVAANWESVAMSATARAEEATARASQLAVDNEKLMVRVSALEEQVRVLVDTITAKDAIDSLGRETAARFDDLTALVVEAITTAGTPRAPGSARRGGQQ